MRSLHLWIFLMVALLTLPVQAADQELEFEVENKDKGAVVQSEANGLSAKQPQDERMTEIKANYAIKMQELLARLTSETDPVSREALQRQGQEIKRQEEIDIKSLHLERALKIGDEDLINQCQKDLDLLYRPKRVQPAIGKSRQPLPGNVRPTRAHSKNPDDA